MYMAPCDPSGAFNTLQGVPGIVTRATPGRTPAESKRAMLRDREIQQWIKDHRSGSSARSQFEQLELFCRRVGKSPGEVATLARRRRRSYRALVVAWVERERRAGRPDSYISTNYAAVRSWLKFNDTNPTWRPKLKARMGSTLDTETVPTPDQLRRVLALLAPRGRAAALLMAQSGLRPGVLANRYTADGLRLRDLPELSLERKTPTFDRLPFLVRVPADLSKSGRSYVTYGGPETADAILAYLSERVQLGEELTPSSPVVTVADRGWALHHRTASDGAAFVEGGSLTEELRRALAKVAPKGTRWRAYVLRAVFATNLIAAAGRAAIPEAVSEFFMGHVGGVAARYHVGKTLAPHVIEELREAYGRAWPYLAILSARDDSTQARSEFRDMVASMLGLSDNDKSKMEGMSPTEVGEYVRDRLRGPNRAGRIVSVGEAEGLLALGFSPELLLLDEPFDNVDVGRRRQYVGLLSQSGAAVVMNTHSLTKRWNCNVIGPRARPPPRTVRPKGPTCYSTGIN